MNKKGISVIVATVLIILITVAAVTIIWSGILPLISEQVESGTSCLDAVQQVKLEFSGFTCITQETTAGAANGNVSLQISHGAKDIGLADVSVLLYAGGNSEKYNVVGDSLVHDGNNFITASSSDIPESNQNKVFVIQEGTGQGLISNLASIDGIAIAPIVTTGNTQESCEATQVVEIKTC